MKHETFHTIEIQNRSEILSTNRSSYKSWCHSNPLSLQIYFRCIWVTRGCPIRCMICWTSATTWVHLRCLKGSVLFIILVFYIVLFALLVTVLCLVYQSCQCLWIVHFWLPLGLFSLACIQHLRIINIQYDDTIRNSRNK
jgi:hypothetical protein